MVKTACTVSLALILSACTTAPKVPPVTTIVNKVEYIPVPAECLTDYEVVTGEIVSNGDLLVAYKAQEQQLAHYKSRLQCVRDSQKVADKTAEKAK